MGAVAVAADRAPSLRLAAAGAVLAGSGVALGAFGAHALDGVLTPARAATYDTAVLYQLLHGVALVALGLHRRALGAAGPLLLAGTLLFCGSLYALVALDVGAFGAVAPFGGAALIGGWGVAAWTLWAAPERPGAVPDRSP